MTAAEVHRDPGSFHLGYQRRDHEVVDYQEYEFEGLWFRGPDPGPADPRQITFLGAAQTLGCFTDRPFPSQVGAALGRRVRNLGYPGAGPRFYVEHPELVREANRSAAVVVQVMSARSEDNRWFHSGGLEHLIRRSDGVRLGAREAYASVIRGDGPGRAAPRWRALRRLKAEGNRYRLRSVVRETQTNWVHSNLSLLERLEVPVVLLWFSTRSTGHSPRFGRVQDLFGEFPQLVDRAMVDRVRRGADRYVECVSDAGLPQTLVSRFDGRPTTVELAADRPDFGNESWSLNRYYPSPEMHDAATAAILPPLEELLS